jgi:hypothetical protein
VSSEPSAKPTTPQPTKKPVILVCGNGICQSSETLSTCSQDCSNIILNGSNTGSNGASGVMFKLTAKRDISVKSFSFYTYSVMNSLIQVYTRVGDYIGHEFNGTGWVKVYDKPVTYMGQSTMTTLGDFNSGVQIPQTSVQSFYIVSTNYILYNHSIQNEGDVLTQDDSLYLHEGEIFVAFVRGRILNTNSLIPT